MTINSETRVAGPFDGNDSTVSFPFTFKVFDSDEVRVVVETGAVETDLELGTDYTVTLNADQNAAPGGSVVLVDPLPTGTRLTLTSALEMLQPVDLTNQSGFYPRVINSALDRLTILLQQLASVVSRTLKFPLTDGPVGDLPGRSARAGTVLAFDEATGEPVAGPDISAVNGVVGALVAINTVSDSIVDVNTVANNIADVNTVADNITDVNTVAGSIVDVNAVANSIADVNTVADNLADVTNFSGVYYGPSATDPTTRRDGTPLQVGDLYFNSSAGVLRVYDGADWVESVSGAITVQNLSGDGSTTAFVLDFAPASENVTSVYIGGAYQQKNTYTVVSDVLTFDAAPPTGTDNIEVVVTSLVPSDDQLRLDLAESSGASLIGGGDHVVDSIAALRALDKTAPAQHAFVTGYYSAGDGGGGAYYLDISDTTSADDGGSVIVATDGGRWKLVHSGTVSLKQFGGMSGDVTAALASAAALSLNVKIPRGSYTVTAGTAVDARLIGDGKDATTITVSGSGYDAFTLGTSYSGIESLTLTSTASRTSGTAINITSATRGNRLADLRIQNQFLAIAITGNAVQTYIKDVEILDSTPTTGGGIFIDGGNDTFLNNVVIDASGTQPLFGLRIQNSQAIWATDCDILHAGTNLKIDPTTGDLITWLFFNNCAFDQASYNGVEINVQGTGTLRGVFFQGCWSATNDRGVYITKGTGAQLDLVTFSNCQISNNNLQGALIAGGTNVYFDGGVIAGNSLASTGLYAGVDFQDNLTGFGVTNVRIGAVAGFSNIQSYGVLIGAGCDNYRVQNNDLTGNVSAGLVDNSRGSSSTRSIEGNLGAHSIRRGTITLASGATSATLAHGLFAEATWMLATPMNHNFGGTSFWTNPRASATTATINVGAAPGTAVTFSYVIGVYAW